MSIAPISLCVEVKAAPPRAFELFTNHMGRWWPKGRILGRNPPVDIVIEPHVGGRWYERDAEGTEVRWGTVLIWEPPSRIVLGWQLTREWRFDPDFLTEVELTFTAIANGGTRLTLEHRDLERFGADAENHIAKLRGGWPTRLEDYSKYLTQQP